MAQTSGTGNRQVLVIERDPALRRIIALGLRQRGIEMAAVPSLGEAWEGVSVAPAVVVLDVGMGAGSEWMLLRMLRAHRQLGAVPLVLLAWECPATAMIAADRAVRHVCLAKPFDARALYEAVEGLLAEERSTPRDAQRAERSGEGSLAGVAAGASAGPSVWPLVTAAGATLAVIGFLVNIALVVAGLVIVFAALLWWGIEGTEAASGA